MRWIHAPAELFQQHCAITARGHDAVTPCCYLDDTRAPATVTYLLVNNVEIFGARHVHIPMRRDEVSETKAKGAPRRPCVVNVYCRVYGTSISSILPSFRRCSTLSLPLRVAEDEHLTVAELALLHRFFDGHGTHRDGFRGAHQMRFGGARHRGKLVHHDRNRSGRIGADRDLHLGFGFHRGLPGSCPWLAVVARRRPLCLQRLGLDVLDGLVDGNQHVGGLGQADQVSAAALDTVISAMLRCFSTVRMTLLLKFSPRILVSLPRPDSTSSRMAGVISYCLAEILYVH